MRSEAGIVYLEGDLTLVTATRLLAEGERAIEEGGLVFDLAGVGHVDSAALSLLLAWRRKAQALGKDLGFRNLPKSLEGLAALYGVEAFLRP